MQDTTAPAAPSPPPPAVRAGCAGRAGGQDLVFRRFADVSVIAQHPAFEVKDADWFDTHRPGWRQSPGMRLFATSSLFHNGVSHQRLRKVMAPAFGPARLRDLAATVRTTIERLLDRLGALPHGDVIDLHALFTLPVTLSTGCALIGLPDEHGPFVYEQVQPLLALLDPEAGSATLVRANRAANLLKPYLERLIVERRARPVGDLASLVAVGLGADEAASALTLALAASFDTTTTLLDQAITALLAAPERAAVACGQATAVDAAISEALRLAAPVQLLTRVARQEMTVGGVRVTAGQEVTALIAAAHRDPEHYLEPDAFRPARPPGRLLTFGGGTHYCLGAQLARLEASLALPAVLRRFPRMAAAGPPRPNDRVTLRGWMELPVVLGR
ncbi:cytochrome P450 [Streptomyces sp. Go40/10]|uniref:cytochrome P450 n=1 Tax=Streptomyces sp. Go40/10 TaxID=2825844 RepID=UPI001E5CE11F|nr:cytochrome P450 [Streptomyces sp. Go40/10]UFQ99917.1 cytochrome P450 [Streptomyces sp. Go40/10]